MFAVRAVIADPERFKGLFERRVRQRTRLQLELVQSFAELLELFRGGASCPWVEESCKSLIVGKARMIVGIAVANTLDELRHGRQIAEMRRVSQVELRSEEHTSELQSLMRTSYAVFCLKKK